ncbi:MAG: hypothetical protein H6888_14275 [Nitratireductor sp.]|nr:hypothetical protein [Nitratireductor sp.]
MTGQLDHINIICYKWGTAYTGEEVNILRAMVKRHLSVPHRFFCITDDATGLGDDIEVVDLPKFGLPGNGPKLWTFSKDFLGLGPDEYVVSLDVDIVIVDSLDFIAGQPELDFVIAPHRVSNPISRGHGAVYRVKVGSHSFIWENLIHDFENKTGPYFGPKQERFREQSWLERQLPGEKMQFFPANKVLVYRKDCHARAWTSFLGSKLGAMGFSTARFGTARLPGIGEAVVSFSGKINPRDVKDSHCGHLKRAPFIAEHWHK